MDVAGRFPGSLLGYSGPTLYIGIDLYSVDR